MQLYLLRHGDAIESPTLHDAERPLSDTGIRQAHAAGHFLSSLSIKPRALFHSPLLRARQTAEYVNASVHADTLQPLEYISPGSDPRNAIEFLEQLSYEAVLLVSHQPFLGTLATRLLGVPAETKIEIRKGTLLALEITRPVRSTQATLRWLLPVELMMQGL